MRNSRRSFRPLKLGRIAKPLRTMQPPARPVLPKCWRFLSPLSLAVFPWSWRLHDPRRCSNAIRREHGGLDKKMSRISGDPPHAQYRGNHARYVQHILRRKPCDGLRLSDGRPASVRRLLGDLDLRLHSKKARHGMQFLTFTRLRVECDFTGNAT